MRLLGSVVFGCTVAAGLFLLMMYLVSNRDPGLNKAEDLSAVNFIRFEREQTRTETKNREKPPEEPPPEEPPPPAPDVAANTPQPKAPQPKLDTPDIDTSVDFDSGPYLGDRQAQTTESTGAGGISSEVVPVVQVPPKYPSTAKRANIEGYVTMEFTVNPDGSVTNIRVVDAQPPRMFNRSAKQALARWKFRPRQQSGKRVARNARQTIRFTLE